MLDSFKRHEIARKMEEKTILVNASCRYAYFYRFWNFINIDGKSWSWKLQIDISKIYKTICKMPQKWWKSDEDSLLQDMNIIDSLWNIINSYIKKYIDFYLWIRTWLDMKYYWFTSKDRQKLILLCILKSIWIES